MVNEVVPLENVLSRAQQLAAELAAKPTLLLRYTPMVLRQRLARRMAESLTVGLALEGLTMADKRYR
jgi:enoyl-CoA hydratase/carnithine racemase